MVVPLIGSFGAGSVPPDVAETFEERKELQA
jgi:hypothetical protein